MTQRFIGTKIILALAMTRLAYNAYRGWELPADENGADDGYLVEYTDGGAPNHPDHTGYISWSPKAQLDNAYRATDGMSFGLAVEALKKGFKVARAGWNGKGMWLVLDPGSVVSEAREGSAYHKAGITGAFTINPHINMKTATGEMQPGWLASQTDMLADDWQLID
ncbi:DUF2829 domain-containing protein [Pseudomonas sp. TH31]|uniref:DUF2829 domain-containing protein n=1 Tax=Pseudomonas sp. TH31 TaxID=2796396 RepID=UPI001F5BA8B8|nr:DUF2829 domain-containing protein [Pseudomonas sp. TH31]